MPRFSNAAKEKTKLLYESLPQDKCQRMSRLDIRDQVIELNYHFFEYVASHTYVKNRFSEYEDRLQTCLLSFCSIWWKYLWDGTGDDTSNGFRTDLAFTTFFKPRLSEMIDRELTEVKYHVYRTLKIKAANQVGKHWSKLEYEDLSKVNLPADDMLALKAIFKSDYTSSIDDQQYLLASSDANSGNLLEDILDNNEYNSVCEFLIQEIVRKEDILTDRDLSALSTMYGIPISDLQLYLPSAYAKLQHALEEKLMYRDTMLNT